MLGAFMVALDMTMVNVALHTLERDFRASVTTIQLQGVGGGMLLPLAQMILAQAAGRSGSDG